MASQAAAQALMATSHRGSLLTDERLLEAAGLAQQAVRQVQAEKMGNMKTTLVFLTIEDGRARWMHIGDSRLYHFRGGYLQSQTMDHSVSQMAVLMGEITPREIRFHEDRNRVLRALGGDNARPEISRTVMLTGGEDVFLLCTDGFWEYVYEEEMEQLLCASSTPQQWLDRMEALVRSRAGKDNDNFTAAAVFC
jgi:serine/threonine protein phosphatase PrpC